MIIPLFEKNGIDFGIIALKFQSKFQYSSILELFLELTFEAKKVCNKLNKKANLHTA